MLSGLCWKEALPDKIFQCEPCPGVRILPRSVKNSNIWGDYGPTDLRWSEETHKSPLVSLCQWPLETSSEQIMVCMILTVVYEARAVHRSAEALKR